MTTATTPVPLRLPESAALTTRALRADDAAAVAALIAACELHDVGEELIEEADIVGDWQRPAFDLATQSVGVLRRRSARRLRGGLQGAAGATRRSTRPTAAAASAPRSRTGPRR